MAQSETIGKGKVARLKRQLKAAGISQQRVATRAGVSLPHVCNVFAQRHVSQPVLDAARALLAEAKAGNSQPHAAESIVVAAP